jgi:hypothetical protein
MKSSHLPFVGFPILVALSAFSQAAVITFESTTLGNLASIGGSTNNPFSGQDGWSASSSNNAGQVINTTTSGEYTGGKGLSGGLGTYIGARGESIASGASHTISFDLRFGSGQEVGVGFWRDADADGLFDQNEVSAQFGVQADLAVPYAFGYRTAGFGTRGYSDGLGGTIGSGNGVAGNSGDWYHFDILITPGIGDFDIVMSVRNLTTGTDIDFDSNVAGATPFSFSLTSAQFGFAPQDADGLFVRVTGAATLDNLLVIPEPSTALLGGLGLLLVGRRRRQS